MSLVQSDPLDVLNAEHLLIGAAQEVISVTMATAELGSRHLQ
jgi:hypothetical protein